MASKEHREPHATIATAFAESLRKYKSDKAKMSDDGQFDSNDDSTEQAEEDYPELPASIQQQQHCASGRGSYSNAQVMQGQACDASSEPNPHAASDRVRADNSSIQDTVLVKVTWKNSAAYSLFRVPIQGGYLFLFKEIRKEQPDFNDTLIFTGADGYGIALSSTNFEDALQLLPTKQHTLQLWAVAQNSGEAEEAEKSQNKSTSKKDKMVKVKWTHHGVIHKFGISAETDRKSFLEEIVQMEPNFNELLKYEDEDGEMSMITSDREFAYAITSSADQPFFRLFTHEEPKRAEQAEKPQVPQKATKQLQEDSKEKFAATVAVEAQKLFKSKGLLPDSQNQDAAPCLRANKNIAGEVQESDNSESGFEEKKEKMMKVKWKHHDVLHAFEISSKADRKSFLDQIMKAEPNFDELLEYKDEDGEMAVITSDYEFGLAISCSVDQNSLQLFTHEAPKAAEKEEKPQVPQKPTNMKNSRGVKTTASTGKTAMRGRKDDSDADTAAGSEGSKETDEPPKNNVLISTPVAQGKPKSLPAGKFSYLKELKKRMKELLMNYGMDVEETSESETDKGAKSDDSNDPNGSASKKWITRTARAK